MLLLGEALLVVLVVVTVLVVVDAEVDVLVGVTVDVLGGGATWVLLLMLVGARVVGFVVVAARLAGAVGDDVDEDIGVCGADVLDGDTTTTVVWRDGVACAVESLLDVTGAAPVVGLADEPGTAVAATVGEPP